MTTLAANKPRDFEGGDFNEFPVIAADVLYEGAAIGLVKATGHARPITSVDRFVGFADRQADNSLGAAAAINVRVRECGRVLLPVSGVTITDVGQPVYAADDDAFQLSPVSGAFVGFVHRFVSSGYAIVTFDAPAFRDPYGARETRVTKSANYTITAADAGSLIWVDTDGVVLTMPAIATGVDGVMIVNGGSYGAVGLSVDPNASDLIIGPGITAADNKDIINTKATANRGDRVVIGGNDADGYAITEMVGTWAREA